ncbi:MAG: hypothetical protein EOP22_13485 [Hyphomicrobiales bacterium]|nr:MAG: hypothetical protein EOP22_13485 [Hyphomicrobiales bacterium]
MTSEEQHSITTALAALEARPMSRKTAMLLALVIDAEIDRRFDATNDGDLLDYRALVAAGSEALALVMELAALRAGGAQLVLEPVAVPLAAMGGVSEAEYMVSLYNGATVPRVLIAVGEAWHEALGVLRAAVAALGRER